MGVAVVSDSLWGQSQKYHDLAGWLKAKGRGTSFVEDVVAAWEGAQYSA
jgi:hypothetical protein